MSVFHRLLDQLPLAPFDILKRVAMWLFTGFSIIVGYGLAKYEPLRAAVELPMTRWDLGIPLVPETVWLYGSGTVTCLVAWLMVPDRYWARRLYFGLLLSAMVCWVFFLLYPTTYPRALYPLPLGDSMTLREFADLRTADSPSNCFPSQHVALAWCLALTWVGYLRSSALKIGVILWAIGVSICTLTTKQHYIIDVPAGMLVGIAAWAVIRWAIQEGPSIHAHRVFTGFALPAGQERRALEGLLPRVRDHQWSLDELQWKPPSSTSMDPVLNRLLNHVIYIEEIAGLNFELLHRGSEDPLLKELYAYYADEEQRHAEGLRRFMYEYGGTLELPGLGNALVLDQFDSLKSSDEADAILVAVSNPVFETFLDAGTIPFLQHYSAIGSERFDAFVDRVNKDEAAHIATNWLLIRLIARKYKGFKGLFLLFNPSIYRGMVAIPWMSLDVYALAHRLGFDFATLLPAFRRLWFLHQRVPELKQFYLWWFFRLFVFCGWVATHVVLWMLHFGMLWGRLWTTVSRVTDYVAWGLFGASLLRRRKLPVGG